VRVCGDAGYILISVYVLKDNDPTPSHDDSKDDEAEIEVCILLCIFARPCKRVAVYPDISPAHIIVYRYLSTSLSFMQSSACTGSD